MNKFIESEYVKGMKEITKESYYRNWNERNGGNLSLRIDKNDLDSYSDIMTDLSKTRKIELDFNAKSIAGNYFLVTGTGKYFRNIENRAESDLGLVRISDDGQYYDIVWGFKDGGLPTSEFPSHLMCHIERLKISNEQKVIFHCHPTNLIALSFTQSLNEKDISKLLWKMQVESIVVFPEGIGIVPYMIPGTTTIGKLTSKKMKSYRAVLWAQHGLFVAGSSLDEAYGLVEVLEKAAMIYTTIRSHNIPLKQEMTDDELRELAQSFEVTPHKGFL